MHAVSLDDALHYGKGQGLAPVEDQEEEAGDEIHTLAVV